jgi:hypothetical protein
MRINFSRIKNRLKSGNIFREAGGSSSSTQITNANLKNFQIKRVGWNTESDDYAGPESDLTEVKSAIETDSYIKVALDKVHQIIFKSGYVLRSENEAAVEYLEQRLRVMEFGTGIPFDVLLREIARNLVYYSNAFLVKSRIDKIQGGVQVKPVFGKKPVGGYFPVDPTTVEILRDSSGVIKNYQITGDEEKQFNAADFIHFYIDKDSANNFGTPRAIACLEDVKILRKIEGNSLALIYRFAIPLYQMKIGLPEQNFMATQQEIDEAIETVNNMPMDGILVTNERTAISAVGADGKAIDLPTYLSYFENRVFSAMGISQAMMGRGGTKQDADSMEGLMHDIVKHYQDAMSIFIEKDIFNELLLEGGYNPIFNKQDIVRFEFNEINLDTKIKLENHYLNQYQTNAIPFEEMRHNMGKKAEVDEARLYNNMITTTSELELIKAKNSAAAATGNGNLKNGKTSTGKQNGSVSNTARPANQHGTTSSKMKESVNLTEDDKTEDHIAQYKDKYAEMYKNYSSMRNEIIRKGKFSKTNREKYSKLLKNSLSSSIKRSAENGYKQSQLSGNSIGSLTGFDNIKSGKAINRLAEKQIDKLINDIATQVNDKERNADDVFKYLEYRLRFACEYLTRKALFAGMLYGYKVQGYKKAKLKLSDDHSQNHESVISTGNFNIDHIPPFAPYCSCGIEKPMKETEE